MQQQTFAALPNKKRGDADDDAAPPNNTPRDEISRAGGPLTLIYIHM